MVEHWFYTPVVGGSKPSAPTTLALMQASAADQRRLLEVQGHDTAIAQLEHRLANLAEHVEVAEISGRLRSVSDLIIAAKTEISDLKREVNKAEADVEQVRTRVRRDEERLNSGSGSPKELEQMQHELQTLARRQSELEDIEIEVLERQESAEKNLANLESEQADLQTRLSDATTRRDAASAEINQLIATERAARSAAAGGIDTALIDLYEKIRSASGGVGAALLKQRRCEGCRLELNSIDLGKIKSAAEDEVIRCEECRRILIRTGESGL